MSIRRRIIKSYIVLILIVLFYIGLSFFLSSFRLDMEKNKNTLLEVNILWGDILVFMNETMSNWDDGETYRKFMKDKELFDEQLTALAEDPDKRLWYSQNVIQYIKNLNSVWNLALTNLNRIEEIRSSKSFSEIEELLTQEPGLQRMYPVYMELISDKEHQKRIYAYSLREYIDAVEFFPIYSDTMNYLFTVILGLMSTEYNHLQTIQNYMSIVFFVFFLISIVTISIHFANSLSLPIIRLSNKLNSFIGKSVELKRKVHEDELILLETSVDELIAHYTHLSKLAHLLSTGHIETTLLDLPRQGVVGNALKEVAAYLKELAKAADWIRDGKYGLEVKVKSDKDVLARSFNIMSREIAEKISTLTNMFETVDEGILLLDDEGRVMLTNHRILTLMEVESQSELEKSDLLGNIAGQDPSLEKKLLSGEVITDLYLELISCRGEKVPVKLSSRPLKNSGKNRNGVMFIITNESVRIRMNREKEKLEAQAVEAELMALRAQINPHFFFNTLNTIAHFIETDSSKAVGVLERLADLFRYTLLSTKRKTVALNEEIHHIREFLEIECIRHGNRLDVHYDIDEKALDIEIPPMLLQPIVENGIKYGGDSEGHISISIMTRRSKNDLVIEISDNGGEDVEFEKLLNNSRTGLKNVNQRLLTLYRSSLEFEKIKGSGLLVRIRIPAK